MFVRKFVIFGFGPFVSVRRGVTVLLSAGLGIRQARALKSRI